MATKKVSTESATIDLDKDIDASAKRLAELLAGRNREDIPLNDEYWIALKNHRKYHGSVK